MAEPSGSPISKVTKLPPKTLVIIAVVGIGGGLIWRKFSAKSAGSAPVAGSAEGSPVDVSKLALEGSSAGNLGTTSGTTSGTSDDTATREVGSITLPVVSWIVTIGGRRYITDGTNLELLNSDAANPTGPGEPHDIQIPENGPQGEGPKPDVGTISEAPAGAMRASDVAPGWQLNTDNTMTYVGDG